MSFNAYDCIVRPGGQITHEVPKKGISAKEIMLLRVLHGNDGVMRIECVGEYLDYNESAELKRLAMRFSDKVVARVFGVDPDLLRIGETDENERTYVEEFKIKRNAAPRKVELLDIVKEAGPVTGKRVVEAGPFLANSAAREAFALPGME
jgi:hypothetical protein